MMIFYCSYAHWKIENFVGVKDMIDKKINQEMLFVDILFLQHVLKTSRLFAIYELCTSMVRQLQKGSKV